MSNKAKQDPLNHLRNNNLNQNLNYDKYPKMFNYQKDDMVLIKQGLKDVKEFHDKIAKQDKDHKQLKKNIQQQYNDIQDTFENQCLEILEWIDKSIGSITNQYPEQFEQINNNKIIYLDINIEEVIKFEWNYEFEHRINISILENRQAEKISLHRIINEVIKEIQKSYEPQYTNIIDHRLTKYLVAQSELDNLKQQLMLLSTQQEQDVMLVFAINSIELNFMQTEKEENFELALKELHLQFQTALYEKFIDVLKIYYEDYIEFKIIGEIEGFQDKPRTFNFLVIGEKFVRCQSIQDKIHRINELEESKIIEEITDPCNFRDIEISGSRITTQRKGYQQFAPEQNNSCQFQTNNQNESSQIQQQDSEISGSRITTQRKGYQQFAHEQNNSSQFQSNNQNESNQIQQQQNQNQVISKFIQKVLHLGFKCDDRKWLIR